MPCRNQVLKALSRVLGKEETAEIYRLATRQEKLEAKWRRRLHWFFEKMTNQAIQDLILTGELDLRHIPEGFEFFFFDHSMDVMRHALEDAQGALPPVTKPDSVRLARGGMPRNLRDLQALWDKYRRKRSVPPRQREIADRVAKAYIKKVGSVWERYSKDFREGNVATQEAVVRKIREASGSQFARSKMIVETESTRYYNGVREEVYGASPDITHFLFVAIRDAATTKWCRSRTELVFTKGSELFRRNVPPCHWNCRSEILPLSPLNPRHLRLIENQSLRAENNRLVPLPKGWNRAVG